MVLFFLLYLVNEDLLINYRVLNFFFLIFVNCT